MKYQNKEIVYIEYQDDKPFEVSIAEINKWSLKHFEFEPDCKEECSFMHFNSGTGGYATEIQAPTYLEGSENDCSFWLHPKAKLIGGPKNIKQIKEPIIINGSSNPFDNSREVLELIYCKYCNKTLDEDRCEHLTIDDDGNTIYMNVELHES